MSCSSFLSYPRGLRSEACVRSGNLTHAWSLVLFSIGGFRLTWTWIDQIYWFSRFSLIYLGNWRCSDCIFGDICRYVKCTYCANYYCIHSQVSARCIQGSFGNSADRWWKVHVERSEVGRDPAPCSWKCQGHHSLWLWHQPDFHLLRFWLCRRVSSLKPYLRRAQEWGSRRAKQRLIESFLSNFVPDFVHFGAK